MLWALFLLEGMVRLYDRKRILGPIPDGDAVIRDRFAPVGDLVVCRVREYPLMREMDTGSGSECTGSLRQ